MSIPFQKEQSTTSAHFDHVGEVDDAQARRIAELEHALEESLKHQQKLEYMIHRLTDRLDYQTRERAAELKAMHTSLQAEIIERKHAEAAQYQTEAQLQTLFNAMEDFLFVFDVDGHLIYYNPVVEKRLGYTADELRSIHMLHIYPKDMQQEALQTVIEMITGKVAVNTIPLVAKDGSQIPVQTRVTHGIWNGGDVLFALSRDISDLKETQEALQQANQQLKHLVDELTQRNRHITLLNELGDRIHTCDSLACSFPVIESYIRKLFPDQSGSLLIAEPDGMLQPVVQWGASHHEEPAIHPEQCWVMRHARHLLVEKAVAGSHCPFHQRAGREGRMLPYLCVPLIAHGETIGILHLHNGPTASDAVRDVWYNLTVTTAEKLALELVNVQMRERLRNQAIRDPLTGLFNRRYLDETLKRELHRAQREHHQVGVIMFDIDHFKKFNDTYGHDGGDTLLRAVGNLLQTYTRHSDIACRYGGEEFTLILPQATLNDTYHRANQFRLHIKKLHVLHNGEPLRPVTVSIGVAVYPIHGQTDEQVMKAADLALYHAKDAGRNRVIVAE